MSADDKEVRQVVLLDFSQASLRKQPVQEYPTRRYLDGPAPGITTADRVLRKLVEACEAVRDDIARQGVLSYESLSLIRAALALAGK